MCDDLRRFAIGFASSAIGFTMFEQALTKVDRVFS
jgi:hypothetical protein